MKITKLLSVLTFILTVSFSASSDEIDEPCASYQVESAKACAFDFSDLNKSMNNQLADKINKMVSDNITESEMVDATLTLNRETMEITVVASNH